MNGGTCIDKLDGFDCLCSAGYIGDTCSTEIMECLSAPCQHQGTCVDEVASYSCVCNEYYTGDHCQDVVMHRCLPVVSCEAAVACLQSVFACGEQSHVNSMLNELCMLSSNQSLSLAVAEWVENVGDCFSTSAALLITKIYGTERQDIPIDSECNLVDRLMFERQARCLSHSLCNTTFSHQDAVVVAKMLSQSSVYKDKNKEQMLDLLNTCGNSNQVAALKDVLETGGYVICFKLSGDWMPIESTIANAIQFVTQITGSPSIHKLTNGDSRCSSLANGEKSHMYNETQVSFIGMLINGTNATSLSRFCDMMGEPVNRSFNVLCPTCGNGVLETPDEVCDDGNIVPGDGCSENCTIEDDSDCEAALLGSICYDRDCGDGIRVSGEECDSGGAVGCYTTNCTILQNFICQINPPYGKSNCSSCGNGAVEALESCDDGNLEDEDGCNSSCHVTPLFRCTRDYMQTSTCRYSQIDLDISYHPSLDRSVVYTVPGELVALADPETLSAEEFGKENWMAVKVTLIGSRNISLEKVSLSLEIAVVRGRINGSDHDDLIASLSVSRTSPSDFSNETLIITRDSGKPADLDKVILSLFYEHDSTNKPDYLPRVLAISVVSVYGVQAPTAAVTVTYVGQNLNPPVVFISRNRSLFREGFFEPVHVSMGSLVVSDQDNAYYNMESATAQILKRRRKEYLNITLTNGLLSFQTDENGTLRLEGIASPQAYTAALNNVSYLNQEYDLFELSDVVVEFSVFDGKFTGSNRVIIRRILGEIHYVEGRGPAALLTPIIIRDFDHTHLVGASVRLVNGQEGDIILVTLPLFSNISLLSSPTDDVLELSGQATLTEYMMLLSLVHFDNRLSPPVNLSLERRLLELSVHDGQSAKNIAIIHVTVTPTNDGPVLQFSRSANPYLLASAKNRTTNASFVEEGRPVPILPLSVTLVDVDSANAGSAQVSIIRMHRGDKLYINTTLATLLDIRVSGNGSPSLNLSGISSLADYKTLLMTCTYGNVEDEPSLSPSVIEVVVRDDNGAVSLPATVVVHTMSVNDAPDVDVGVGVGNPDEVTFTEGRQTGIHILSHPHRAAFLDEEEHCLTEVNVTLTATPISHLDDGEFIYSSCFPLPAGVKMIPHFSGRTISFVRNSDTDIACEIATSAFKDILACVLYFNTEDEPSVFVNANSTMEIQREILIEVLDNGIPPRASTAVSVVRIKTINDHAPVLAVSTDESCIHTSTSSRIRRYLGGDSNPAPVTNSHHTLTMLQVPVPVSFCVSHVI
jgi:cysteine-rich repeat protein